MVSWRFAAYIGRRYNSRVGTAGQPPRCTGDIRTCLVILEGVMDYVRSQGN